MSGNLAYAYDGYQEEPWEELINGQLVAMSPPAGFNHNTVRDNLAFLVRRYLWGKPCVPCNDGMAIFLTEKDYFIPDFMVVCDRSKIRPDGIHGAADLVVEVLSPSTSRRDRMYKKDLYQRSGVREYWLVSPAERMIEQYVLEDGQLVLRDVYHQYPAYLLDHMTEAEKAAVVTAFRCAIFPELEIRLEDVFAELLPD